MFLSLKIRNIVHKFNCQKINMKLQIKLDPILQGTNLTMSTWQHQIVCETPFVTINCTTICSYFTISSFSQSCKSQVLKTFKWNLNIALVFFEEANWEIRIVTMIILKFKKEMINEKFETADCWSTRGQKAPSSTLVPVINMQEQPANNTVFRGNARPPRGRSTVI